MMRRLYVAACLVSALFGAGVLLPGVAFAGTGWELSGNTYPTNLIAGVDGVQEVTPEGSSFTLSFEGQSTGAIAAGATPAVVRAALEGLSTVGAGNVSVEPGEAGHYRVTFIGALGDVEQPALAGSGAAVSVLQSGAASGTIAVDVLNVGSTASGGTITFTDRLPAGLRAKRAGQLNAPSPEGGAFGVQPSLGGAWVCSGNGGGPGQGVAGATVVTCVNGPELPSIEGGGGIPTLVESGTRIGFPQPPVAIEVEALQPNVTSTGTNVASIAGGGAANPVSTEDPVTVSPAPAAGGLTHADAWVSNENGETDLQAGSHPYLMGMVFDVTTSFDPSNPGVPLFGPEIRDLETVLPPGLVGNLSQRPECTRVQLTSNTCPSGSMVGILKGVNVTEPALGVHQLYNMVPERGTPAEIGFVYEGIANITFSAASGGDNAIIAHSYNVAEKQVLQVALTLWGSPNDPSHYPWRGFEEAGCQPGQCVQPPADEFTAPLFTLPTACGDVGPVVLRETAGWQDPEARSRTETTPFQVTGCENLGFEASFSASLESGETDAATGHTVEVTPGLGGFEEAIGLSAADLKNVTVQLPVGVSINPGRAAGLTACGATEDALTTPTETAEGRENDGPASCQPSSKIGTVQIRTPLLTSADENRLEGGVYVLDSSPPNLKLLIAGSADGINIKLVLAATLCQTTGEVVDGRTCGAPGQIIASLQNAPQLPFTLARFALDGGANAALTTPTRCGAYTAQADFTPWSTPYTPDFNTTSTINITAGTGGGPCPSGNLPFTPTFTAGSSSDVAAGFTSFSMDLERPDGQQRVEKLSFTAPAGLAGLIASVPLCTNAQAEANACPESSKIGHTVAKSGPGSNPLVVPQPGQPEAPIYLTEAYGGGSFGLSIVVPLHVGPFVLETQRIRASLQINPSTGQVTATTNPLPQQVDGVPTDLRSIQAVIDRPGFLFNPTNCNAQTITGTAYSTPPPGNTETGESAALSSRYAVGGCRALTFKPGFTAATSGKTNKKLGASLHVKLVPPHEGPQSSSSGGTTGSASGTSGTSGSASGSSAPTEEANIARVKVDLPKQLPSRLTTLQKACTAAVFDSNPAACPAASIVASAKAITPILPVPLEGPAYFVSHGNEAFPQLILVLQGYGITIDLVGDTFISKAGITSSTFAHVPDAPVSSFELTLPQGKYSALAANANLCTVKGGLKMPTEFVAQNGAEIKQSTPITVEGCSTAISIVSHKVKGRTLTVSVSVPAAGRVTASGKGVSSSSKSAKGRETLTFKLTQKKAGKLKTKIKLTFTPSTGKDRTKQSKSATVEFEK
jgi:hypothetical protein